MERVKEMLKKMMESIKEIAELLYQQKSIEAYHKLDGVLGYFIELVDTIYIYKKSNNLDVESTEKLADMFKEALVAMEECDFVLLADILQYEIFENLQRDYQMLEGNVENEQHI